MASGPRLPEPDDPYRVLGLRADASPDEVTRAFRRLARAEHPDVRGGAPEADQQYLRIRGAYELLRDRARRGDGDREGGAREGTRQDGGARRIPVKVRSRRPGRGGDLSAELRVSLVEGVYGATRQLPTSSSRSDARVVRVRVPPGTVNGTRLRLRGQGAPGQQGGPPGDLLVTVEVVAHDRFCQSGRDLHTTLMVGYPQLVLGANLPFKTLAGQTVTAHVPAGTAPGTRLRLARHGVPASGHTPAGDLIIETRLYIPADPSAPARAALAALAEALPPPREDLLEQPPTAGGAAR